MEITSLKFLNGSKFAGLMICRERILDSCRVLGRQDCAVDRAEWGQ